MAPMGIGWLVSGDDDETAAGGRVDSGSVCMVSGGRGARSDGYSLRRDAAGVNSEIGESFGLHPVPVRAMLPAMDDHTFMRDGVGRSRRRKMGLTQADVAKGLGVTVSVVCRWEKGRMPVPWDRVEPLAKALEGKRGLYEQRGVVRG